VCSAQYYYYHCCCCCCGDDNDGVFVPNIVDNQLTTLKQQNSEYSSLLPLLFHVCYISRLSILAEHFNSFFLAGVLLSGFICFLRQPSQLIVCMCHSTLHRSVTRSEQHDTNCTQNRLCKKYGHSHYAALYA
jgi:hypothetical protein